jgi:adenine C2-methylase RlmN of 23S rRNA A2503 and tRNA A37
MSAQEEVSSQETDTQSVLSGLSQPPFPPNSILDRAEFLDKVIGVKIKAHHLENFYHELHQQAYPEMGEFVGTYQFNRRGKEHEDEEPLPESLLAFLMDSRNPCVTMASTIQKVTSSASGKSVKLDVKLHDGKLVETMITRVSDKGKHVASVSISSQVGCSVGGAYSPSTDFVRDLSASEMIEQVIHAMRELQKEEPSHVIRKVAFTGGGEPLLNYDPVVAACRFIADSFKLGRGCITIATVGITPRIFDLTRDLPDVNLCLRLYAPNQELRSAILPVSSRFGLAGIFEALDHHMTTNKHQLAVENHEMLSRKRRVMIEYLMGKLILGISLCLSL